MCVCVYLFIYLLNFIDLQGHHWGYRHEVTKLIDFGAHAGSRTHDIPSAGLVMRVSLRRCDAATLRQQHAFEVFF